MEESQLGALPEPVAKVAATSIQRVEASFVGARAARRKEFDTSAVVQSETLHTKLCSALAARWWRRTCHGTVANRRNPNKNPDRKNPNRVSLSPTPLVFVGVFKVFRFTR